MKYFNLVITIFCLSIAHSQNTKNTKQLYSNIYKKQVDDYIATWLDRDVGIVKKYLLTNINIPYCCFMYGTILLQEKNFKQADIYITKAANTKLPEALNSIGDGYYSGDIRPKNHVKALEYYRWAAKMGYGPAQINAGVVFLKHAKTAKGVRKAIHWFSKAINNPEMEDLKPYILIFKTNAIDKLNSFKK